MTVFQESSDSFVYTPPSSAYNARRILLKPNWGYPKASPVTTDISIIREVIAGIRRVNSTAEILIVEGVCCAVPAIEIARKLGFDQIAAPDVHFLDADSLPCITFANQSLRPQKYSSLEAPQLLAEVDCRISISPLKVTLLNERLLISASIKNLFGLLPRARYHARSPHARGQLHRPDVHRIIADVYWTLGVLFDGVVVDATRMFVSKDWRPDVGHVEPLGKILWGDDLPAVDREACRLANREMTDYLHYIEQMYPA